MRLAFNIKALALALIVPMFLCDITLAAEENAAPAQDTKKLTQRDLRRVRNPILRICAGGHSGTIKALAFTPDSARLCSAGLDKNVAVWNLRAISRDLRRVFLRERTIRWQVGRGPRGSIQALASAPSDGLLAFGGYGLMGGLGEIMLVDPKTGKMAAVLDLHRQAIAALAFSADGNRLVSSDTAGRAVLWQRPTPATDKSADWKPVVLQEPDEVAYGKAAARDIAAGPKFRPVTIAADRWVVLPEYKGQDSTGRRQWHLRRISLDAPDRSKTLTTVHSGQVTALAASKDGSRLASADWQGNLFIWDLDRGTLLETLRPQATVLCLAFSPDANQLLAGTARTKSDAHKTPQSRLIAWDMQTFEKHVLCRQPDHIQACQFSPNGKNIAYTGGGENDVFLQASPKLEQPQQPSHSNRLGGKSRRVLRVAFATEEPFYRIALGTDLIRRDGRAHVDLQRSFNITQSDLVQTPVKESDWLANDWLANDWTARRTKDGRLQLFENGQPKGKVDLASQLPDLDEGNPICSGWLADAQGKTVAVLVGTNRQNSIYVCRLVEQGVCPIVRHFRGHSDVVTSLGVSRDLQYLVSGSFDGTAKLWSLSALHTDGDNNKTGRDSFGRWGAEFQIKDNRLLVTKMHPAGPLFRKGMRSGDTLDAIQWPVDSASNQKVVDPAEILKQLAELPWGTQVVFKYSRRGAPRADFQLLPAWQPLASLLVSTDNQWAFWTPEGYYNASVEGYTLFGWQINHGLRRLPSFYRADQFAKRLERPDVIRGLLAAGSLQESFDLASARRGGKPPVTPELQQSLPAQIASTPRVEILSPKVGTELDKNSTTVTATIQVPAICKLDETRVFANGVVSTNRRLIKQEDTDEGRLWTFAWDVRLPSDRTNLIQVVAGTDAQTTRTGRVLVRSANPHQAPATKKKPRLMLLALAVDDYRDQDIPDLNCCRRDAQAIIDVVRDRMAAVYDVRQPILLAGAEVTAKNLKRVLNKLKTDLADASPDDLVLMFLAGHGVADERSKQYYFIGHDARFADICDGKYRECVSWADFSPLADIPCRKVALLDTCHSGAIQAEDDPTGLTRNPKAGVRKFQEDVIFTVTASAGDEKAIEDPDNRHGIFTMYVVKAIQGAAADGSKSQVTLNDMVRYVKRQVPKRIEELTDGRRTQHPTAAPHEILEYVSLPLTKYQPATRPNNDR